MRSFTILAAERKHLKNIKNKNRKLINGKND